MTGERESAAAISAQWHVPQVAQRADGRWGSFCAACSAAMGDYINPCRAFPQTEWPPAVLKEVMT